MIQNLQFAKSTNKKKSASISIPGKHGPLLQPRMEQRYVGTRGPTVKNNLLKSQYGVSNRS